MQLEVLLIILVRPQQVLTGNSTVYRQSDIDMLGKNGLHFLPSPDQGEVDFAPPAFDNSSEGLYVRISADQIRSIYTHISRTLTRMHA